MIKYEKEISIGNGFDADELQRYFEMIDDVFAKWFEKDVNSSTPNSKMEDSKKERCHYDKFYFDDKVKQYKQTCPECGNTWVVKNESKGFSTLKEQLELEKENLKQVRNFYPSILDAYEQVGNSQEEETIRYVKCYYVNGVCINCGQVETNEVDEQEAWIHTLKR